MSKALTELKAFGSKLLSYVFSERVIKLVFFRCANRLAKMTTNTLDDQVIKELETMFINKSQEETKGE